MQTLSSRQPFIHGQFLLRFEPVGEPKESVITGLLAFEVAKRISRFL